jgi:hypothetical protein
MAALFALLMSHEQRRIYRRCTGRHEPPSSPASEAWLVCGRRAGKSFVLALIAVFLACIEIKKIRLCAMKIVQPKQQGCNDRVG